MSTKLFGFSLIELLITLSIVGIIAAISLYSYSGYILRGRRLDGMNALLNISLAQERYRDNNSTYGNLSQVWGTSTASPDGYYTLTVTNNTATGFTATATAVGKQANDQVNGTSCATLTLSMNNATLTKQPSACWPS